ncbi:MAG: hypothetical protein IJT36_03025 [Alphaproteobacteria bacterium]|nr:hypothetical protein [Alphaproteobacteria bacterium]
MFKRIFTGILAMMLIAMCGVAFADEEAKPTFKERLAQTEAAYANHAPLNFVFYLDSEGHANYEERVLDELIKTIQSKMPLYAKVKGDSQFLADFDLFREEKYDALMKEMQKSNPGFAVMGAYDESGRKVKMTKEIIDEFLKTTDYDGMVILRIDKVQEKAGINYANAILFGFGGVNTKVEMDVTTRVYNKKSPKGYVFNNKQRVVGKVSGSWAPDTASRKAVPMAMKNISKITVE